MVISGKFSVKQAPLSARLGTALGTGLGQAIPEEISHQRLAHGLRQFEKEAPSLTPLEAASRLFQIKGITPQMVQTLPQLLQQQKIGQAYGQAGEPQAALKQAYQNISDNSQPGSNVGVQTPEGTQAAVDTFIHPTQEQMVQEAMQLPSWQQDPQGTLGIIKDKYNALSQRSQSLQARRQSQLDVQNTIKDRLKALSDRVQANLPGNVYSDIENETFNLTKPLNLGGKGYTEEQAAKEGEKKLQEVSRQYEAVRTLGGPSNYFRNPKTTLNGIGVLQKDFKERDDLRNFADMLVTELNASAPKAYSMAYPLEDYPKVYEFVKGLPTLGVKDMDTTNEIVPDLFKKMGYDASPLSIANALNAKGYDGNAFLAHARQNSDKLSPDQKEQLAKPTGLSLGDLFMENMWGAKAIFGGIPLFYHYFKE